MQIEVLKKGQSSTEFYDIIDFKVISDNTDLLLVRQGKMGLNETSIEEGDFLEIHKVQALLSCKTEFADNLIVAFYIVEGYEPETCVLKGLPKGYSQAGEDFILVDYKSYSQICELTAETKLSLQDYIRELKSGNSRVNTLFIFKNQAFNLDKQNELWKQ